MIMFYSPINFCYNFSVIDLFIDSNEKQYSSSYLIAHQCRWSLNILHVCLRLSLISDRLGKQRHADKDSRVVTTTLILKTKLVLIIIGLVNLSWVTINLITWLPRILFKWGFCVGCWFAQDDSWWDCLMYCGFNFNQWAVYVLVIFNIIIFNVNQQI